MKKKQLDVIEYLAKHKKEKIWMGFSPEQILILHKKLLITGVNIPFTNEKLEDIKIQR